MYEYDFYLVKTIMETKLAFGEKLPFSITPVQTGCGISDYFDLKS